VTSSVAVFEAAIRVKSMYIIKACSKPEKEKDGNQIKYLHKSVLKNAIRSR